MSDQMTLAVEVSSSIIDLPALAHTPLWLTTSTILHHCNDCGRELNPGDEMVWAQNLGVPFCVGCAHRRDLINRASRSRRWRQHAASR